jgi:DNA-binding HxlR family transcriptional regulator
LIIRVLLDGKGRFSEIEQVLSGISGRMLSERLRELEHEDIVQREVFAEIPVRIEYSLTEKGKELASALDPIQNWAEKWLE